MKINKFTITMFTAFAGMYSAEMPEYTGGTGRSSTEYGHESPGRVFISSEGSPVSYRAFVEELTQRLEVVARERGIAAVRRRNIRMGITEEFAEEQHLTPEEFAEELTRRLETLEREREFEPVERENIRMGITEEFAQDLTRRLEALERERGMAVRRRNIRMGIIGALAGTVTIASLLLLLNGPLTT